MPEIWTNMDQIKKDMKSAVEKLISFLNEDINYLTEALLLRLVHDYTFIICIFPFRYSNLTFSKKFSDYSKMLLENPSVESFQQCKDYFIELQDHVKTKVNAILECIASNDDGKNTFIEIKGQRRVSIDSKSGQFTDEFLAEKEDKEGNLNQEKLIFDVIFLDLIRDLNLVPGRFRQCPRCNNYFYKWTGHKKVFCSARCGSAERQPKYIKNKGGRIK